MRYLNWKQKRIIYWIFSRFGKFWNFREFWNFTNCPFVEAMLTNHMPFALDFMYLLKWKFLWREFNVVIVIQNWMVFYWVMKITGNFSELPIPHSEGLTNCLKVRSFKYNRLGTSDVVYDQLCLQFFRAIFSGGSSGVIKNFPLRDKNELPPIFISLLVFPPFFE